MDEQPRPKHFTKEPWWLVPVGGAIAALLPLIRYAKFATLGVSLSQGMLLTGLLGTAASALLVARSHIRSVFWSNIVLSLGIVVIALGVCLISVAFF